MNETNVFITGGGIGGLTLALKLAQKGVHVTLVEKLPGKQPIYKGELLQPKSMQIFDSLGIYDEVCEHGHRIEVLDLLEMAKDLRIKDQSFMDYTVLPGKYNASYMIHHEDLKKIVRDTLLMFPHVRYMKGTACKEITDVAVVQAKGQEPLQVKADFYIGAEGRASVTRKAMDLKVKAQEYNHHFLTVTFPRPENLTGGQIISTYNRFLGLFPLPNNEVRSVYLIPAGEYKKLKEKPISYFHKMYTDMAPSIDGYVQKLTDWSRIQLMIPIKYHADFYVKNNKAIIGDAAHAVHPMAGEGMNMAIQDADILGELLCDMYSQNDLNPSHLQWYENVRKERADFMLQMSHLSALAYSFPFQTVSFLRRKTFERIEEDPILHFKQMLNVSGLGIWKESFLDRAIQGGLAPKRRKSLEETEKEMKVYSPSDDYPWKIKGLSAHSNV